MNHTQQEYESARSALEAVLSAVPLDRWSDPSPCEGWTASDVVSHLVQTQREFFAGRDLDVGPAPDPTGDPAAAWKEHAARVLDVVRDTDAVSKGYDGYFGTTTVGATFEQFYVWDMLVHRWDVATSAGLDAGLTDSLARPYRAGRGQLRRQPQRGWRLQAGGGRARKRLPGGAGARPAGPPGLTGRPVRCDQAVTGRPSRGWTGPRAPRAATA